MRSRYLYNLQIYNVLILVSLSIEENLVCSQVRWGWIFLARPRIVRFPSVISLHLSRDLTANILEFWLLTSRVAAWTGVSYHWISPISSSPQWCPGSAPAWRPPGCRESVCRATAVLGRHEPALGVPLPVQLLNALHRQAGLGPEDVDHHHVGRHLHRLGAGSVIPPAVGTRLLLLRLLELPELFSSLGGVGQGSQWVHQLLHVAPRELEAEQAGQDGGVQCRGRTGQVRWLLEQRNINLSLLSLPSLLHWHIQELELKLSFITEKWCTDKNND